MSFEIWNGHYTYRSYLNLTSGNPNELLWAEGDLFLRIEPDGSIAGQLGFPAEQNAPERALLDITGRVSSGPEPELLFTAQGRPDTAVSEFRYSYRCRPGHSWPHADPAQRASLVGTVVRDEDHGAAKAGATTSFVAVQRDFLEPRELDGVALIPEALDMLANETHRLRHTVWHTVRAAWTSPEMSDKGRQDLRDIGWGIDDPPFQPQGGLDLENGAGEDFLYMHRRMIQMVNRVYADAGKQAPAAWQEIPSGLGPQIAYRPERDPATNQVRFVLDPDSSGLMVPPATPDFMRLTGDSDFLFFNKTARGFSLNLVQMARRLRSSAFAGSLPLGAYGNLVEFTVHNWLHMRWASTPRDPETGEPAARDTFDTSPKWTARHYDYLGDFHSSHVNPLFWRLHGWVDGCIDTWFAAHEALRPGTVKRADVRGIDWFEPGDWVRKKDPFDWPGAGTHHDHGHHAGDELKTLKRAMEILARELGASPQALRAQRAAGFAEAIAKLDEHGF